MDTSMSPSVLPEIESFDSWSPDLEACAPDSYCMRLEAVVR